MAKPRVGRNTLSSIDMLPPEADAAKLWALEELRTCRLPSSVILEEFNLKLADLGLGPISKGAWSRRSVKTAVHWRRLEEVSVVSAELKERLKDVAPEDITLLLGELLKVAVFEHLDSGDNSVKDLAALSRVLRNSVKAQSDTVEYRKALAELNERLTKIAEAVNEVGTKSGVGAETLAKITNLLTTGAA